MSEKVKIKKIGDQSYELEVPEVIGRDELIQLLATINQILEEEHKKIIEERKAKGIKTYVEYRGDKVVSEY